MGRERDLTWARPGRVAGPAGPGSLGDKRGGGGRASGGGVGWGGAGRGGAGRGGGAGGVRTRMAGGPAAVLAPEVSTNLRARVATGRGSGAGAGGAGGVRPSRRVSVAAPDVGQPAGFGGGMGAAAGAQ